MKVLRNRMRLTRTSLLVLALLAMCCAILLGRYLAEPRLEGRTVRGWLNAGVRTPGTATMPSGIQVPLDLASAVRKAGTNSLPFLDRFLRDVPGPIERMHQWVFERLQARGVNAINPPLQPFLRSIYREQLQEVIGTLEMPLPARLRLSLILVATYTVRAEAAAYDLRGVALEADTILPTLIARLNENPTDPEITFIFRLLASMPPGHPGVVAACRAQLRDGSRKTVEAARILQSAGEPPAEVITALRPLLKADAGLAVEAMSVLRDYGETAAVTVPDLMGLLATSSFGGRTGAAQSLARARAAETLAAMPVSGRVAEPALRKALEAQEPHLRSAAADALKRLRL